MIPLRSPNPDFPVEEKAVALVRGHQIVLNHLGHWPSFHDMEITRLTLDRIPERYSTISRDLVVEFYIFDLSKAPEDPERKQALLEVLFSDISNFEIKGWGIQNPILGFSLRHNGQFLVEWGGCGHDATFACEQVTIVRLRELNPFCKSQPNYD